MSKIFKISIFLFVLFLFAPRLAHADPPDELDYKETYVRATVIQVLQQGLQNTSGEKVYSEKLKVQLNEGKEKGKVITVGYQTDATFGVQQQLSIGSQLIIDSKPLATGHMFYAVYQPYGIQNLWWMLGIFVFLLFLVVGLRGIGAIIGLFISLGVILWYIVPSILQGQNPLLVCIIGSLFILPVTTYIAHGISLKTTVALIGTSLSLLLAAFFSFLSIHFLYLLGLGDESAYALQLATNHPINLQGLLLGGIIIGTLGALNDITTTQAITIFTLARENPKQRVRHLFWKSMHIGREHIISMINTLVLAYAGSSLVVFLFFAFNPAHLPWWMILNDQTTLEEIVRALIGSSALMLAVPITTLIGSSIALRKAI